MRPNAIGAIMGTAGAIAFVVAAANAAPETGARESFAPLVERVADGVVHVRSERAAAIPPEAAPGPGLDGSTPGGDGALDAPSALRVETLGSGFVIDPKGLIVTNEHLVSGAARVQVRVSRGNDRYDYPAEVVGTDSRTDLALLRIRPRVELGSLRLGDSDTVSPGDPVIAVADPAGRDKTVASGIIRARGPASLEGDTGLHATEMLETDAEMRAEESGGPLLDADGNVIGVTIAAIDLAAQRAGGFATPSNIASAVIEDLKKKGRVERGTLGFQGQAITPDLAETLPVAEAGGVLVSEVEPEGPADRSGIESGEVIVGIDGREVLEPLDLVKGLDAVEVGEEVNLEVLSPSGKRRTVSVKVESQPEPAPSPGGTAELTADSAKDLPRNRRLGIAFEPPAKSPPGQSSPDRLVVYEVDPGSPAEDAGLAAGDRIERVFSKPVESPEGLDRELDRHDGDRPVLLLVLRGDQPAYVPVTLSK